MIRIVTDTSTLYSPEEGEKMGIDILPLSVTVNHKTYKEYVDINSEKFIEEVRSGYVPSSSQPAIGEVMEKFEKYPDDEIVDICMADGLSGTYLSAMGAKEGLLHQDRIHVINTRTLCGPHRYMVQKAIKAVREGCNLTQLKEMLNEKIESSRSFLLPQDFEFLKRGGRLTPLAATIGGLLKIQPVMTQTDDGMRLEKFTIARTFSGGYNTVIKEFSKLADPEKYIIFISHADAFEQAKKVKESFLKQFPNLKIELLNLSPAFITQGGPGCLAIQWTLI